MHTEPAVPEVAPQPAASAGPAGWPVLAVVAIGGAIGAAGRYGVDVVLPAAPRGFPLGTFLVNVIGCLLIGVLAGVVFRPGAHRLLRPFVAVGVLGGFTTFSTYTVEAVTLALDDAAGTALGYLLATVAGSVLAVESGLLLNRWLTYRRHWDTR